MASSINRRHFFQSTSACAASATFGRLLSGSPLLAGLSSLTDEQVQPESGFVKFRPEIEPLVRLIENTQRQQLMDVVGQRVRKGLSYQQLLAALFLAGIRNVQPRPAVGFKFHAVLVVNSAHVASMASPEQDRWLPIFWALDEFKSSQARDVREGNWTMPAVDEAGIPDSSKVADAFQIAMTRWDESAADVAAAGVARYLGAAAMLDLFARFCARDFRSIGHKSIYLANSWRTLQTIGWEHAEPVLRSLAYAMLNHTGEPNPADSDLAADRSWKFNETIVDQIQGGWMQGKVDDAATTELLSALRTDSPEQMSSLVVRQLNEKIAPQSILDAAHTGAAELLMRQPGIVALHAVTTVNAMRFLFDHVADPRTRQLLLLQTLAFLPQFRDAMSGRGKVADVRIDGFFAEVVDGSSQSPALDEILGNIRKNASQAAVSTMQWLANGNDADELMHAARRLIFLKGNDAHDYKFSSASLEDYYKISPTWRNQYLAASTYHMRGSSENDNSLVERIHGALS